LGGVVQFIAFGLFPFLFGFKLFFVVVREGPRVFGFEFDAHIVHLRLTLLVEGCVLTSHGLPLFLNLSLVRLLIG
jgi:hypothetical protein